MIDKILLIAYYWPPGGGPGVQRWLKLTRYLSLKNIKIHVLTVNPKYASYFQMDESLKEDIYPDLHVHHTRSIEPLKFYERLVGKKNVPSSGYLNVDTNSWKHKVISAIRSHLFIPDPRKGWNHFAYRKAKKIINQYNIKYVITTSPPHSTQLIGDKLKRKFKSKIHWIADFRDPWTDIYFYKFHNHSKLSHSIDKSYEKKVLENTDAIITASALFKKSFLSKTNKIIKNKITVVTNGYDPKDFEKHLYKERKDTDFVISYTGTITDFYKPEVFFDVLHEVLKKHPQLPAKLKFIGMVSPNLKKYAANRLKEKVLFIPPVHHHEAIQYMLNSDLLLLITQGEEGDVPGKTFEYLASHRKIICIGEGKCAEIIANCGAGKSFSRNEKKELYDYLDEMIGEYLSKKSFIPNQQELIKYSRPYQAEQVLTVLKNI